MEALTMPTDRQTLRAIEAWTGHRKPKHTVKTIFFIVLLIIIAFFAGGLSSCVQTTTETTDPVTGKVTKVTEKKPAPGSLELAGQAITVLGTK